MTNREAENTFKYFVNQRKTMPSVILSDYWKNHSKTQVKFHPMYIVNSVILGDFILNLN